MTTNVNPIIACAGLSFRTDSVNGMHGGSDIAWEAPVLPEHAISSGIELFSVMTACSVRCAGPARPVLTLWSASSAEADYGGRSNFGSTGPSFSLPQGAVVIAAAA